MKLCRVGPDGQEKPAIIDADGALRDLSGVVDDILVDQLALLSDVDPTTLPLIEGTPRYGVPVSGVRKYIAIGLNYRDHALEARLPIPDEPVIFMKAISCLGGAHDDVNLPRGSTMMDWECELGIVISKTARYVSMTNAMDHVAGYVLVNDLSERRDQTQRGGTWDKGKGHDGFGPVGPWLVTPDELGDAPDVPLVTRVNGVAMQQGRTTDMIFGVAHIVSYVSEFMTLTPGDIIATGTPAGVGVAKQPDPVFLREGDVVTLDGGPLGNQSQRILAPL